MARLRLVTPEPVEVPDDVARVVLAEQDRPDSTAMVVQQPVRIDGWTFDIEIVTRWEVVEDG